jgi:ATP-dependent helicase HrpA
MIGFPALADKTTHCDLEVFDDPAEAARVHRIGLRRLFSLQLKEQLKYLEKNIPGLQQMGMQFMSLGSQEELRDQIIHAGLDRACLQEPLPKNAEEFNRRKDEGKSRLGLLANEIARLAAQILAEYITLPKKLQGAKAHAQSVADMQSQLQALVGKRFIADNSYTQLTHFPRYLKAVNVRLEKLRADPARDARLMAEWMQVASPWQRAQKDRQKSADPRMQEFRWLLEELRVSLFAQELRTPMPVSVKRLQKVWESMQR